jgi:hypothetical protein
MDRKYSIPLIIIVIVIILIVVFSTNLLLRGYSIEFYKNYDEDNILESNPTLEHPIPYVFRNSSLAPVRIAVLIKKDYQPAFDENVTLDIWNQDLHQYIERKTNSEGYAVFITTVNATRNNNTVYSYRIYLNDDKKIATSIRNIVILKDPVDLGMEFNPQELIAEENSGFDPITKKPSDIPEGDNFIVVGALIILLSIYLVTRRRDE